MSDRLSKISSILVTPSKSRLQIARESTSLDGQQLRDLMFGPGNYHKHIKPTLDYIDANRHVFTQQNIEGHSVAEQREEGVKMVLALRKFWKLDIQARPIEFLMTSYTIGMYNGGISTKSMVHFVLYTNSLLLYRSNQKHIQMYQRAKSGEDLGCFCLTEFHHGSYSQGIQTLATYDPKTDEFELTTQGTKGMKFWIGALAEVANTAVLWAQLIINGKSEGPHPFYLPIRCKKTHNVLPGITIGDCGLKRGLNYIDNGYMMLDKVRIPRENLLGKYGSINQKGQYISPFQSKSVRFGMQMSALSATRASLSHAIHVFNAVTIALRYAHSRKQFDTPDKKDQIAIIDYPLTQIRLIPEICRLIVQMGASLSLAMTYFSKTMFDDNALVLELHAISSAVKAKYTWTCLKASQECRTILGGHGYSSLSRIPSIVEDIEVNVTWDGDNNMILQQTSKYLMKSVPKKIYGKYLDISFISQDKNVDFDSIEGDLRNINNVQIMLQDFLRVRYQLAVEKMNQLIKKYQDKQIADLHFHPEAGNALSLAYADYFTFVYAKIKIEEAKSQQMKKFIIDCIYLWAFCLLQKERYGTYQLRSAIQKEIVVLCSELVSRCVVATDFLACPSHLIGSPFANPNGDGFKEYIGLLFTRKGAFTRADHFQQIKKFTSSSNY